MSSEIRLFEIIHTANRTAQHSAPNRRVRHDRHAQFATRLEQFELRTLNVEGKGRVLHLHGIDVRDFTRAAEGSGRDFREADVLDFAFGLQLGHGFDGFFYGRLAVEPVAVVEVDVRDAETAERGFAGLGHPFGGAVVEAGAVGVGAEGEFRGEEDFLACAGVAGEPLACGSAVNMEEVVVLEGGRLVPIKSSLSK